MNRQPYTQVSVGVNALEQLALEDLQRMAGLHSEADVVRLAMQRLCDHYDLDSKLFAFRKRRDPRKASAA